MSLIHQIQNSIGAGPDRNTDYSIAAAIISHGGIDPATSGLRPAPHFMTSVDDAMRLLPTDKSAEILQTAISLCIQQGRDIKTDLARYITAAALPAWGIT